MSEVTRLAEARRTGSQLRERAGLRHVYDRSLVWWFANGRLVGQVGTGTPAAEVEFLVKALGRVINGKDRTRQLPGRSEFETSGKIGKLSVVVWGVLPG